MKFPCCKCIQPHPSRKFSFIHLTALLKKKNIPKLKERFIMKNKEEKITEISNK